MRRGNEPCWGVKDSQRAFSGCMSRGVGILKSRIILLADFRTIASRIVLLNQAGSLQGAWKQATRRRLLHGVKADGEGG